MPALMTGLCQNGKKMVSESKMHKGDGDGCLPESRDSDLPCEGRHGLPSLPHGVTLSRYRITLDFPLGLALTGFSGFVLHGVLGASLREVSPTCYTALYGDQDIVRPWLITGFENEIVPGASAFFELRLFNEATSFLPDLVGALMLAGCAGLGPERSPFDVTSVEIIQPGLLPHSLNLASSGVPLSHELTKWCSTSMAVTPIRVLFESPIALKERNDVVRTQPSFGLIISRTLARFSMLAKNRVLDTSQKQLLLSSAHAVKTLRSSVHWQEEQRYSGRQQRTMPFGGLVGETVYEPSAAPFASWLDAATMLGIGGKTTFGFGQLRWCHEE